MPAALGCSTRLSAAWFTPASEYHTSYYYSRSCVRVRCVTLPAAKRQRHKCAFSRIGRAWLGALFMTASIARCSRARFRFSPLLDFAELRFWISSLRRRLPAVLACAAVVRAPPLARALAAHVARLSACTIAALPLLLHRVVPPRVRVLARAGLLARVLVACFSIVLPLRAALALRVLLVRCSWLAHPVACSLRAPASRDHRRASRVRAHRSVPSRALRCGSRATRSGGCAHYRVACIRVRARLRRTLLATACSAVASSRDDAACVPRRVRSRARDSRAGVRARLCRTTACSAVARRCGVRAASRAFACVRACTTLPDYRVQCSGERS